MQSSLLRQNASCKACMARADDLLAIITLTLISDVVIDKILISFSERILKILLATPDADIIPIPTSDILDISVIISNDAKLW